MPAMMRMVVWQRGHLGSFRNDCLRHREPAMQPQVRMMGCSGGPLGFLELPQGVLQRLQVCWLGGRSSARTDCRRWIELSMLVIIEAEFMLGWCGNTVLELLVLRWILCKRRHEGIGLDCWTTNVSE